MLDDLRLVPETQDIVGKDLVFFQVMKKIHVKDCQSFQVDLLHYYKGKNLVF